jgi:hypothetical protein
VYTHQSPRDEAAFLSSRIDERSGRLMMSVSFVKAPCEVDGSNNRSGSLITGVIAGQHEAMIHRFAVLTLKSTPLRNLKLASSVTVSGVQFVSVPFPEMMTVLPSFKLELEACRSVSRLV